MHLHVLLANFSKPVPDFVRGMLPIYSLNRCRDLPGQAPPMEKSVRRLIRHEPMRDMLIGTSVSLCILAVLSLLTPSLPPFHDATWYVRMATEGVTGDVQLAAPFAYRIAVPLMVHLLYIWPGVPVATGFAVLAHLAGLILLVMSYLFARSQKTGIGASIAVVCCVGFSLFQVKFALAAESMVDIEAAPLMLAAVWALLARRYGLSLICSSVGLLFKEFLAVPLLVAFCTLLYQYAVTRETKPLHLAIVAAASFGVLFVLPRLLIPVEGLFGDMFRWMPDQRQRMDYIGNLTRLLSNPLNPARIVNLAFDVCSYWLPALMIATPARMKSLWFSLQGERGILAGTMVLVLGLAAIGGSNLMIFVTYSVPVLIVVLSGLLRQRPHILEILLTVCAVLIFNRVWMPIPSFADDFSRAVDLYAGWSDRLNYATLERAIELAGYLVLAALARKGIHTLHALPGAIHAAPGSPG